MDGIVIGGVYRHFKGGLYKVIDIAYDSNNCSRKVVIYEQLQKSDFPTGTRWIRNIEQFTDVHPSGYKRFELLKKYFNEYKEDK